MSKDKKEEMEEFNAENPVWRYRLIELLNKSGFILEQRVKTILERILPSMQVSRCPWQLELRLPNEPIVKVDIDAYAATKNIEAVIECKRANNYWLFTRNIGNPNILHLLYENEGYKLRTMSSDLDSIPINSSIHSMGFDEDLLSNPNTGKNKIEDSSRSQEKGIYQLLNLEIAAVLQQKNPLRKRVVLPVLVTNAPLFFAEIGDNAIDGTGNLLEFKSIKNVNWIALNFNQQLRWDNLSNQIVKNVNDQTCKSVSVFVVNIVYLAEFLTAMDEWVEKHQVKIGIEN
jgi:hypothetical protein